LPGAEGLPDHPAADQDQQAEGDPVIYLHDVVAQPGAQEPAEQRHQGLERNEGSGECKRVPCAQPAHLQPLGERHGEGIGGNAERKLVTGSKWDMNGAFRSVRLPKTTARDRFDTDRA
jgi:hypothetical protein